MIDISPVLSTFSQNVLQTGNVNHVNRLLGKMAKTGEMLIMLIMLIIFGTFGPTPGVLP